jgi:low affinity Fe/Cu permease
MKLSNKAYDVLKWICMVFLPAAITLFGVIGKTLEWSYTDTVLTIAVAFNTFLGSILGISNVSYRRSLEDGDSNEH